MAASRHRRGVQHSDTATAFLNTVFADGRLEQHRITVAVGIAEQAHAGQVRRSGEPYATHPIEVAMLVAEWGMDETSIVAALLHDVVEDTAMTLEDVEAAFGGEFGAEVAFLVGALTKLDGLKLVSNTDPDEKQAANLQKLLVAMASDARVLIVKIADRLHNVRTLQYLHESKARRIARETMDVYAPLAARLGMAHVAGEMDDLCFAVLFPERCAELTRLVAERAGERDTWITAVVAAIDTQLTDAGITAEVRGRAKRLWSVYEKMVHKGRSFDQIYDLIGVRIIVADVGQCYTALGLVHALYSPIAGRFKDWIATPRFNMYQSLHTTVMTPSGAPLEVQIRTEEMHQRAEWGVAAHWRYKTGTNDAVPSWVARLSLLSGPDGEALDAAGFLAQVTKELISDEVLCFTPRGDVVALVANCTPVDFAYAVHTDVGHACSGARVNGAVVSLTTKLHTGDRVEIITRRQGGPNQDWLHTVTTERARSRIKQWFARESRKESSEAGRAAITRELTLRGVPARIVRFDALDDIAVAFGYQDEAALCSAVSLGKVQVTAVVDRLAPDGMPSVQPQRQQPQGDVDDDHASSPVLVEGADGIPVRLARCCTPLRGDPIVAYVIALDNDAEHAVSVHRSDCAESMRFAGTKRLVEATWRSGSNVAVGVVLVQALDRPGLLSDVTRSIADGGGEILASSSAVGTDKVSRQRFDVAVCDVAALDGILQRINAISGVFSAARG